MKELYKDMYYRGFGPGEYEELKKAQMEIEANTSWVEDVTDIQIGALSEPMDAYRKDSDPTCKIPLEVLLDTVDNVGLTVMYNGTEECLRDCAMPTLLSTAGIGGLGITRTAKESKIWLADGLTAFLRASRKKSSLLMRGGKVSAILSPGYEYMPGSQLLAVCDDLEYMFGTPSFLGGSVSHELTVAEFAYPESEKVMTDAYNSALVAAGRTPYARLTPIVQYRKTGDGVVCFRTVSVRFTVQAMVGKKGRIYPQFSPIYRFPEAAFGPFLTFNRTHYNIFPARDRATSPIPGFPIIGPIYSC